VAYVSGFIAMSNPPPRSATKMQVAGRTRPIRPVLDL
jgi:hypothetical protein